MGFADIPGYVDAGIWGGSYRDGSAGGYDPYYGFTGQGSINVGPQTAYGIPTQTPTTPEHFPGDPVILQTAVQTPATAAAAAATTFQIDRQTLLIGGVIAAAALFFGMK